MHSILSRINNVSAFLSTCMMFLLGAIALSSWPLSTNPEADVSILSTSVVFPAFPSHQGVPYSSAHTCSFDAFPKHLDPANHWERRQYVGSTFTFSPRTLRNTTAHCDHFANTRFPANAHRYPHHEQDVAFVQFNISTDLTPLFHWNTKQLFLYLAAEYTNSQGVKNDVVIWDRIVRRKEDAVVNVVARNKYVLHEISSVFKNASPAHYTLKYNIMPHVGYLEYGEAGRTTEEVAFPKIQQHI